MKLTSIFSQSIFGKRKDNSKRYRDQKKNCKKIMIH
jgi:hypothetical protein